MDPLWVFIAGIALASLWALSNKAHRRKLKNLQYAYEKKLADKDREILHLKCLVRIVPVQKSYQGGSREFYILQRVFDGMYMNIHSKWIKDQDGAYLFNLTTDAVLCTQRVDPPLHVVDF